MIKLYMYNTFLQISARDYSEMSKLRQSEIQELAEVNHIEMTFADDIMIDFDGDKSDLYHFMFDLLALDNLHVI